MSDVARLAAACAALFADARDLVRKLDDVRYAAPGPDGTASAGAQLRHAIEYAGALVAGLPVGRIDYDRRARDPRVEREPAAAIDRIEALRAVLLDVVAAEADRPLAVRGDEPDLPPGEGFVASSLARELRAVASHTTHHFALIALTLRTAGVRLDPDFGVAPATRAFVRIASGTPAR
jgi:hypothetical protein